MTFSRLSLPRRWTLPLSFLLLAGSMTAHGQDGTVVPSSSIAAPEASPAAEPDPAGGTLLDVPGPAGGASPAGSSEAGSINRREIGAARLSSPPVIDGDLSDPAWVGAAKAERFTDAITNAIVEDQTVAWVGYDDANIYVGFHAFDRDPNGIVGRETKRNTPFRGEDYVTFSIDPYNTHSYRDRSYFTVNPLGTQFSQLAGGRANKLEWQGEWKSAAKRTADGWTAEMAIPWFMLNYPTDRSARVAGINFDRFQERTKIHSWWSNIGPNEFLDLNGTWIGVTFPRFRPRFSILPYLTAGWGEREKGMLRAGVDVRSALTPALTGVATLNPDFANVEGAVEGIDFSYGERFVPDHRPFFLEGRNIYVSGGVPGLYYHSLRIPSFDAGLNLYGKATDRDTIGVLAAADIGERVDWILREWHTFSPTASADVGFFNRDDGETNNRLLVLGENYRRGLWNLDVAGAASWTDGRFKGGAGNANLRFESPRWNIGVTPHFVEPEFEAALGFIPFTDFKGTNGFISYSNEWRTGPFREIETGIEVSSSDHYDGRVFRRQREFNVGVETRSDWSFDLGWAGGRFEAFNDSVFTVRARNRVSDPFHTYGIGVSFGKQAGHSTLFLTPSITWRFGTQFTVGVSSAILRHFENRHQHIATFNYDFSPGEGIGGRIVSSSEGTGGYLAYRRSGYGGVEQWVILGDPNADRFQERILTKVVWPF